MEMKDHETLLRSLPDTGGLTYRKILRMDLERDRCTVVKSDPEGWQPGEGPITNQLARFALDGAIHREDAERFVTFTRLDQLRRVADGSQETFSILYRRKVEDGFRWNLMEAVPDPHGDARFVTLCVKDVDDLLWEGMEREGLAAQNLEDRAYIISSLSSLFFSTYYIDLEQDTFRTVTQLGRVGDVLGDAVSYSAALSVYANHFVHPEDREEYLRIMDVKNLRENLRWWQPCVVFEYRKMSEGPGARADKVGWVRASAVLARTGEDDLPMTAVYAAQDITDGRRTLDGPDV